ncbi:MULTISPECIES: helix-turn-helix domain-containing protein [Pseudoalteromonas]|uniref:HTH araC/xylS-type domain-containing protein n=1 Tax=Pseudoalteromonas amylolytica TaxID=1859457 RepID=A0A1S1MZE8_9GAMM|nr:MULTISPECIES: helix-turn-helix domain-containing protein [Pseudoalteromonas]OHU88104.1 hypothetical protein BFC16_11985 [Pseudoalteromonas sp. JW3]OHU91544.1 hypothetical protein BET10_12105 [Pseudoalteromonas amylolytica]
MNIVLTDLQVIDLFFRFAAVGLLILLMAFLINRASKQSAPHILLCSCIIGYVLLTAPIENSHYGGLRNVLLFFTDLTPYAILWVTLVQLNHQFKLAQSPKWIVYPAVLWLVILAYFFLVKGGTGLLHDINHGIALVILLICVYLSAYQLYDDLDNQRRNARQYLILLCALYMTVLVVFEFASSAIRNSWQFSLTNAVAIFAITLFIAKRTLLTADEISPTEASTQHAEQIDNPQLTALNNLMEQGAFLQPELTIGKLAEQLGIPAHQLRQLINQALGFSNFSHYLNSYRIPWVCERLNNPTNKKTPILTLAFEAGYGSIAPFNRAFKQQMGLTPTQYRDQF